MYNIQINQKLSLRLPKISICTPSYNQGRYLERPIKSVIDQDYPNLEYIIIDGNSTDESVEIIKKYEQFISYWISETDQGQTHAIMKGMGKSTGDIINWLNSDDILLPGSLFELAKVYKEVVGDKSHVIFCGGGIHINELDEKIKEIPIRFVETKDRILPMAPPLVGGIQASWFITKAGWDYIGGINPELDYTMDTELYYRCFSKQFSFVPIHKYMAAYRIHENTKTLSGWKKSIEYKKSFYFTKLSEISSPDKEKYRKKIKKLIFGFYMKSINQNDSIIRRIRKIIGGIVFYPHVLFSPYQIKRMIILVFKKKDL